VSCFAFGAEETGKTSFLRRLEGKSTLREIFGAGRSIGAIPETVRINPSPSQQDNFVRLLFVDMGGQKDFEIRRSIELQKYKPLGILLFLDHRGPKSRDANNMQIDRGSFDRARIERHREAIRELTKIISSNPQVKKACNAMIIVANKQDLWKDKLTTDDFYETFRSEIKELQNVSGVSKIPPIIACSIQTGEGVPDVLRAILELSGWEIDLGVKIRIRSSIMR
jgi:signal recognition particle receptor subunit beta